MKGLENCHTQLLLLKTFPQEQNLAGSEGTSGSGDEASTVRTKPQVLWSLYFNCVETSKSYLSPNVPQNVHLCSGPDLELDFEFSVQQVSCKLFNALSRASLELLD